MSFEACVDLSGSSKQRKKEQSEVELFILIIMKENGVDKSSQLNNFCLLLI